MLTEACFLYARAGGDSEKIVGKVRQYLLDATFTLASEAAGIELLMQRYADTPMSLADACLVRLTEVHKDCGCSRWTNTSSTTGATAGP